MHQSFLLPHSWKVLGWVLAVPALLAGIAYLTLGDAIVSISWLTVQTGRESSLLVSALEDLTNEIIGLTLLVGLNCIAFAREKVEDERVMQIRLASWQWGILVNSILLGVALIVIYGDQFFNFMVCNLYTPFLICIVRFHYTLYFKSGWEKVPTAI